MHNKNLRSVTLCLTSAIFLSACMTQDPYTGEKESTKATTGAVFGAIAGALVGAAASSKKDRQKAALIGAGVGAVAGGSVGHYMDRQEDKLRSQLRDSGVSVTRDGDNIILNMPSNITFDTDSYRLNPQFYSTLDSVVLVLNEFRSTLITVSGHTDSTGSTEYNQQLSEKRSLAVANYLINKGVQQQRLAAVGRGEMQPIAANNTAQGRAMNRRVELKLEPITQTSKDS